MSSADIIQFDAYISQSKAVDVYIDTNTNLTAKIDLERETTLYIQEKSALSGYINQAATTEVEL